MHLLALPQDILVTIADLVSEPTLNALLQTCSPLYALLNNTLYKTNIRDSGSNAILWAALYSNAPVAKRVLGLKGDVNCTTVLPRRRRRRCRAAAGDELPASVTQPGPSRMVTNLGLEVRRGIPVGLTSPLTYASATGDVQIMQILLSHGADVEPGLGRGNNAHARRCWHNTPLMMAADRGHVPALHLLLSHPDTDVNTPRAKCNTPLSLAAANDHLDAVRTLLRHGADANTPRRGGTALTKAVAAGRHQSTRVLLLEGSGDVSVSVPGDQRGYTAIFVAVLGDHPGMISLLLGHKPREIERRDAIGRTPLCVAAWGSKLHALQSLLEHGADVERRSDNGQTALWWAVLANNPDAVRVLLGHGKSDTEIPAVLDGQVSTVLMAAMSRFYHEVVDVLLGFGADPDHIPLPARSIHTHTHDGQGSNGGSDGASPRTTHTQQQQHHHHHQRTPTVLTASSPPLHTALAQHSHALTTNLLSHNASPNLRDPATPATPLYTAIHARDTDLVQTLLLHGADANSSVKTKGRRKGRVSPLGVAVRLGLVDIERVLVEHGAYAHSYPDANPGNGEGVLCVVSAVSTGDSELVRRMLGNRDGGGVRVDVKACDRFGRSPLGLARLKGDQDMERVLLEYASSSFFYSLPGTGD